MDSNITMEPKSPQQAEWPVVSAEQPQEEQAQPTFERVPSAAEPTLRAVDAEGILWNQTAHRREDDLRISPTKDGYELNSARSSKLFRISSPKS